MDDDIFVCCYQELTDQKIRLKTAHNLTDHDKRININYNKLKY